MLQAAQTLSGQTTQAWEKAFGRFKESSYTYGDAIRHEELIEWLELQDPYDEDLSPRQHERAKVKYACQFDILRKKILIEFKMDMVSKFGFGYKIIVPEQQSQRAVTDATKKIQKALNNAKGRVHHVNLGLLSNEQKRENLDAQAKLSFYDHALNNHFKRIK